MRLHTASLQDHMADIRAILRHLEPPPHTTHRTRYDGIAADVGSRSDVVDMLSCLPYDGLTHILLYLPPPTLAVQKSLRAVSAHSRLDMDLLHHWRTFSQFPSSLSSFPSRWSSPVLYRGHLCYVLMETQVDTAAATTARQHVSAASHHVQLWWVKKCGLPLVMEMNLVQTNSLLQLLLQGSNTSLCRSVTTLHIHTPSPSLSISSSTSRCASSRGDAEGEERVADSSHHARHQQHSHHHFPSEADMLLTLLPMLVHLETLWITSGTKPAPTTSPPCEVVADTLVTAALRAAASLPIAELRLPTIGTQRDTALLSRLTHLRRLTVHSGVLSTLDCLCPRRTLTHIVLDHCPSLTSLHSLIEKRREEEEEVDDSEGGVAVPHLRVLVVRHCSLASVDGLGCCPRLQEVDVSNNKTLRSLTGLSHAPSLRLLTAANCDVSSFDGPASCPLLEELDVNHNPRLRSCAPLASAHELRQLSAQHCGLDSLAGLSRCSHLHTLYLDYNSALQDLKGLANSPALVTLSATHCRLTSLDGLHSCPALREVNMSFNLSLLTLAGLAGAPALESVTASYCSLTTLEGLGSCLRLQCVDVSRNALLRRVGGVAAAPRLRLLDVRGCKVTDEHLLSADVQVLKSW